MNNADLCLDFQSVDILTKGPWDQERFEDLLVKWIVATDQPFHTVDEPEFRKLMTYAHHPSPELKIPHRNAVKRRVMKMGEDTVRATKESFAVCKSQLYITRSLTSYHRQVSKAKSAFHSTHGHQAIIMRSWQLLRIMSREVENWVRSLTGELPLADCIH